MNLLIALPIHLALPKRRPLESKANAVIAPATVDSGIDGERRRRMVLMGIAFAGGGFVISAVGATLLVLMNDLGMPRPWQPSPEPDRPHQVAARLVEYVRRNLFSPPLTAIVAGRP